MKIMRLIVLLLVLGQTVYSQQYWIHQPCPTTKFLTRVMFVDTLFGWAGGDSGVVIKTTDGGQNWSILNTNSLVQIEDMFFFTRNDGWIVANDYGPQGTTLLRTTNGGTTWLNIRNPDSTNSFMTAFFFTPAYGFLAGLGGAIYKTTNSGSNWTRCQVDSSTFYSFPIRRIRFFDSQKGFCVGGQFDYGGVLWTTTNAGTSWAARIVSPEPNFDIKMIGNGKYLTTGGDAEFGSATVLSADQGANWSYNITGCYGLGRAVAQRTPSEIWLPLAFAQMWAVSTDSGASGSWRCIRTPDTTSVYDATFMSPTFGWAVGCTGFECKGSLLKYNTAIIGISELGTNIPQHITLYQNFPNPFNPVTTIRFALPHLGNVQLDVFDATGKKLHSAGLGEMSAGEHSYKFDGSDFASGIYFYRLTMENKGIINTLTKKMAIVK